MNFELESADHVEAVIKVAERCNINCSYCYVFNKGNDSPKSKPVKISRSVMSATAEYLSQGVRDLGAKSASVVFHGGEPLMMGKRDFDHFATLLRNSVGTETPLRLGVQTNGMLVDDEWIRLFARHGVGVGVSLDGPREINDIERRDFRDRGTYDRVVRGLRLLQAAADRGDIPWPGIISVIQPTADGRTTYRHFVDELGVKAMSFHLPMDTHDTLGDGDILAYARFLCDAFDEWCRDRDKSIQVRMFTQLLSFFTGAVAPRDHASASRLLQHVTIESDGDVEIDELKPTRLRSERFSVFSSSLREFANSSLSRNIRQLNGTLSAPCMDCVWRNYCRGGLQHGVQVNRWSDARGFDNPSVLCAALKKIYAHVANHMLSAGFPEERLLAALDPDREVFVDASVLTINERIPDGGCNAAAPAHLGRTVDLRSSVPGRAG